MISFAVGWRDDAGPAQIGDNMSIRREHGNGSVSLPTRRRRRRERLRALARRYPLAILLLLMIASNILGTAFNVIYNFTVIADRSMHPAQRQAFRDSISVYNAVAWPVCIGATLYLFWPLQRCLVRLRAGEQIEPHFMEFCRRRLVNLPKLELWVNAWGWLPGAVYFPLVVCIGGGSENGFIIWARFLISFTISALITIAQTFFLTESFLIAFLYPEFFRDARPEQVAGVVPISYQSRLILLWLAVACMPLLALFMVLWDQENAVLAISLFLTAAGSSLAIFWLVGRQLLHWVKVHALAMAEVSDGNFDVRIAEQRPDEWGRLTNHFNDMAGALGRAREESETFGQFVSPEVRDQIMARMPGLQVAVLEITVMFADIRGFTRRCAGEPPERIGILLNRFLTLALHSVEGRGGLVNKFLGDGFMALYGATGPCENHADLALASAQDLLVRLRGLNDELICQGQTPLAVGIGIHSGPALVGCFGASLEKKGGMRREFTAIGETVNFCQRLEQLTKTCGGPILLSEATRCRLRRDACMACLGPQPVPGAPEPIVVHRAAET
jgi:adenylate cyclase